MEKEKKEVKKTNKNKIVIIISLIILLFAILFIYWYFNRKFDVVFDYNNGKTEEILVKYLNFYINSV